MADAAKIEWTFGTLEAVLSDIHDIPDTKRTAFQARLKNFHRLGWPSDLKTSKGKTALYDVGQIIQMALAIEMTQLGLPPERSIRVLARNHFPVRAAVRLSCSSMLDCPENEEPLAMFLYFDPSALSATMQDVDWKIAPDLDSASDTFFYAGIGVVKEMLADWTSSNSPRISLINITSLIGWIVTNERLGSKATLPEWQKQFLQEAIDWGDLPETPDRTDMEVETVLDAIAGQLDGGKLQIPSPINEQNILAMLQSRFEFSPEITAAAMPYILEWLTREESDNANSQT